MIKKKITLKKELMSWKQGTNLKKSNEGSFLRITEFIFITLLAHYYLKIDSIKGDKYVRK